MSESAQPAYLTHAAALRFAQIPPSRLAKLVALGKVKTRAEPGETVRYSSGGLEGRASAGREPLNLLERDDERRDPYGFE